jgi:hypothetical protein
MPSITTLKRLFAESGNLCAFPACTIRIIDSQSGVVIGEICHIKAREQGGPRYDPLQSPEERDAYDNLILLCSIHHKVIDSDIEAYTDERLSRMKEAHRSRGLEPSLIDDQALNALCKQSDLQVMGGSIITTINQTGGQVAHIINNQYPPARLVTPDIRQRMLSVLAQAAPSKIGFASTHGDREAHEFKLQLMSVFRLANWEIFDMQTFMFFGVQLGLVLTIPFAASEDGLPQIVAHALAQTGNPVSGNRGDIANNCGICVQVWSSP